jgi:hypothetical protein
MFRHAMIEILLKISFINEIVDEGLADVAPVSFVNILLCDLDAMLVAVDRIRFTICSAILI